MHYMFWGSRLCHACIITWLIWQYWPYRACQYKCLYIDMHCTCFGGVAHVCICNHLAHLSTDALYITHVGICLYTDMHYTCFCGVAHACMLAWLIWQIMPHVHVGIHAFVYRHPPHILADSPMYASSWHSLPMYIRGLAESPMHPCSSRMASRVRPRMHWYHDVRMLIFIAPQESTVYSSPLTCHAGGDITSLRCHRAMCSCKRSARVLSSKAVYVLHIGMYPHIRNI